MQPVTKKNEHYEFLQRAGMPECYPIWKNKQGREFILCGAVKKVLNGKYKWFAHVWFVNGEMIDVPFEKIEVYEKFQFNLLRKRKK